MNLERAFALCRLYATPIVLIAWAIVIALTDRGNVVAGLLATAVAAIISERERARRRADVRRAAQR